MYFDSRRSTVLATNGMVATSQPLAATTGLRILMEGGNAVDAAIATAAALNVVEPMSTGVGGDMFALVWDNKKKSVSALNGSGRAPAAASIDELLNQGHRAMPDIGVYSIATPGTVHGWETLLNESGTMPLSKVLEPAINYAENGFPVSDIISVQWQQQLGKLSAFPSGTEMLPGGRAPSHGDLVKLPTLASTLRAIAEGGSDAFYNGPIAQKTAAFVQEHGGWLAVEDMATHTSDWDEPISVDYRGVTCWECPPNGQGIAALEALNIAEGFDIKGMGAQSADAYHHLIEAMRLGFADAFQYVADPRSTHVPIAELTSKDFATTRRALIDAKKAMSTVPYGKVHGGSDTVYISVVDGQGNACSFINSVFSNFGSGMVVPGTGIVLHNRASLFSLDPNHANHLAPHKRPYNTIIPGMATIGGELHLSYGMMGAFMQPQGHLQLISNMVDHDMDPQQAINALRFMVGNDSVILEEGLDPSVARDLQSRGHNVGQITGYNRVSIGGAQVIQRDPDTGVLRGGSEPRKDGCAVGY
ncbi:MAG: gamma-glutamyltransferase [Chloroflexi bacterium]|nr:gamma-glutamyltransferase [Chloroflexota bacterium]MDA1271660.1 gamma-glutamyltransferase [Chloroflexota bacterium]